MPRWYQFAKFGLKRVPGDPFRPNMFAFIFLHCRRRVKIGQNLLGVHQVGPQNRGGASKNLGGRQKMEGSSKNRGVVKKFSKLFFGKGISACPSRFSYNFPYNWARPRKIGRAQPKIGSGGGFRKIWLAAQARLAKFPGIHPLTRFLVGSPDFLGLSQL